LNPVKTYPLFSIEKTLAVTPDYDQVPDNTIYNVYDIATSSRLDYKPRVFIYRNISDDFRSYGYEKAVKKLGELLRQVDQLSSMEPDEYGVTILSLIQQVNKLVPVDRITVQWYEHPDPVAEAATKPQIPQPGKKKVRRAPALDLGPPVLKTELDLPQLGPKFYHVLNNSTD